MHHDQIMESYTPLNNYLSNCVIKLHIKLQAHAIVSSIKKFVVFGDVSIEEWQDNNGRLHLN